jgi:hypothetical protein
VGTFSRLQLANEIFNLDELARFSRNSTPMKILIPPSLIALALVCFAFLPKMQAVSPPPDGGYPGGNTAEGTDALLSRTTGTYNTAIGIYSLLSLTDGNFCTGVGAGTLLANTADENTATGAGALLSNTIGTENTANGAFALFSNTDGSANTAVGAAALLNNINGSFNTANGVQALFSNTDGNDNSGLGWGALASNTSGSQNTSIGEFTLFSNSIGVQNTAVGYRALAGNTSGANSNGANTAVGAFALDDNVTGGANTAIGYAALGNSTGGGNIALGDLAGVDVTTGNSNIIIGNRGLAGDDTTIRIGNSLQTACYIAGIAGQTVGAGGSTCFVDNDGKLGVFLSARRFKTDIADMGAASKALLALRPVTFHYKPELDKTGIPQFGLVAEEVAKVNPDLVTHDAKGDIYTVRYEAVNAMLLNEFLKEHRKVQEQDRELHEQAATIAQLKSTVAQQQKGMEAVVAHVKEQDKKMQRVTDQIELSKPAPQTVVNSQ